jgi:hypothetical protein
MSLTKSQFKVLFVLSDGNSYSNQQLAKRLKRSDTNTSKDLTILRKMELVTRFDRENLKDGRRSDKPHNLTPNKFISFDDFKQLLTFIAVDKNFRDAFFNSDYITICINDFGLLSFLEQFKDFLNDQDTKRDISRGLFGHKTITKGYTELLDSRLIEILQWFDALEAYNFYKKVIGKNYLKRYCKEEGQNNANDAELLRSFLEYDIALNPFNSYPVNDPIKLLFLKPFERLYDDVYLIDHSSDDILVRRAYLVYSHFKEILRLGIKSMQNEKLRHDKLSRMLSKSEEGYKESKKFNFLRTLREESFCKTGNLTNIIRQFIFYWNIASLKVDFIYCRRSYWRKKYGISNEVFHLQLASDGLRAIDIHYKRGNRPGPSMTDKDMIVTSLWCGEGDPFSNLRYCYSFREMNLEKRLITVDEIASYLERNLTFE